MYLRKLVRKNRPFLVGLVFVIIVSLGFYGTIVPAAAIIDSAGDETQQHIGVSDKVRSSDSGWPYMSNPTTESENEERMEGTYYSMQDPDWPYSDNTFGAEKLAPTMEGRWFPKLGYSSLTFEFTIDSEATYDAYIWAWIVRDQDTYNRYLTFYFDDHQASRVIIGSSGFKGNVWVPGGYIDSGTTHTVTLTINYGGYKDRGWKLLYIGVGNYTNGKYRPFTNYKFDPYSLNELTPATGQSDSIMEYDVIVGESTNLELTMTKRDDSSARSVYVYFETSLGYYSLMRIFSVGSSPVSISQSLGTYTDDSHRKLKLVILGVGNINKAKMITRLSVTHVGWHLEVDYMSCSDCWDEDTIRGHLDAMNDEWYDVYSYHRVYYQIDDVVIHYSQTTVSDHQTLYTIYFDHKLQYGWQWVLCAHDLIAGVWPLISHPAGWFVAWPPPLNFGIGLSGYDIYESYEYVIRHEFGHNLGISRNIPEAYCTNPYCIMSPNGGSYYCQYHWLQRQLFY